MLETIKNTLKEKYIKTFNEENSDFFSSSGRMEILGNHTDHNHGLVLVGAINLEIICAASKRNDNIIKVFSEGYGLIEFDTRNISKQKEESGKTIALIKGVCSKIKELGLSIGGFNAYIKSNVPAGSGVSSSAAFECLIVKILNYYYNADKIDNFTSASVAQYAENVYFDKPCGLLDQCGVAFGGVNMIDFKSIKNPKVVHLEPDFKDYEIIITNCGGDHSSLTEHYSSIRKEMEDVAHFFHKKQLRNVPYNTFFENIKELRNYVSDRAILRAIHFYNENNLVKKGFSYLKHNNIKGFLKCINDSGNSSYMLLQNTCVPGNLTQNLNLALTLSKNIIKDGAVRVHGGGFEGTILAFVNKNEVDNYVEKMSKVFLKDNVYRVNLRNYGPIKF